MATHPMESTHSSASETMLRHWNDTQARFAWLGLGALASLFSVGGSWDIPLAAWITPVFLLRFVKTSSLMFGVGMAWLVAMASSLFWNYQMGIPFQASTMGAGAVFGTMFTLPYFLDRLLASRAGLVSRLFVFPASLAVAEFLIGTFSPLGTAYGMRAITQSENLPLLQIVSITGPYSIAFLIGWFATTVNWIWENPGKWTDRRVGGAFAAVLITVLVVGALRIGFTPTPANYVNIAGISPEVALHKNIREMAKAAKDGMTKTDLAKWRAASGSSADALIENTRKAAKAGAQVVIWAEGSVNIAAEDIPALLQRASTVAKEEHIYLSTAFVQPFTSNETHMFAPDGKMIWSYNKNYPVPGLEPIPPVNNAPPVISTPFGRISNVICFDADFPALMQVDTDIMLVPGSDWPEMGRVHTMKMASIRAIENGYALLRQDFNGQSAAFDRLGRILASQDTTPEGSQHMMMVAVPTEGSRTIYNRVGDLFAWLCMAGLAAAIGRAIIARRS